MIYNESSRQNVTHELRGAFNKFPDFFVQAFKIVVNSWTFSMLLLYMLTGKFLWFHVQMNTHGSNWNTPY